jgi:hypothetical protein
MTSEPSGELTHSGTRLRRYLCTCLSANKAGGRMDCSRVHLPNIN